MAELFDLMRERKATFWAKILQSLKPGKKPVKVREGSFGVPLDQVTDKFGVDTKLGSGASRLRIPTVVDNLVSALKTMNLDVEGIFRKNGNIKNMATLQENLNKTPTFNVNGETSIQLAAMLKKFLREMPEPLLTWRLYRLFICSQKISNPEHKKKQLQYVVCLLPKPNRDLLEVLLVFIRAVAQHQSNKMDITNLATVFAPNILYAKEGSQRALATTGQKEKEDSMVAIETLKSLIMLQDSLWQVPAEIQAEMQSMEVPAGEGESPRDGAKKFEQQNKKSHDVSKSTTQAGAGHEAGQAAVVGSSVGEEHNGSGPK